MDARVVIVLAVIVGALVLTISLVASSLKKLTSKEVGLQYDTIQKDLDSKVFTEGLHLGPVGYEFIIFPNIYTTMKFTSLKCLNKDGVDIELDVTFQYRVQMVRLMDVVLDFKDMDNYSVVLKAIGIASLHEACSRFNTTQYQANRGDFQDELSEILKDRFKEVHCDVEDVQVNNIKRPAEYESAIRSKERAKEDIQVAREERPRLVTEANTTLREAQSEATIIIDRAESDARIKTTLATAAAEAIKEQYSKEAEAYEAIMSSDGLAFTPEGLVSYMGVRVLADAKNPVYIGLKSPAKASYIDDKNK